MDNAVLKSIKSFDEFQPYASIPCENKKVLYSLDSQAAYWRVKTIFKKDPRSLHWMAAFEDGEVMVDIGANVGMFSLWAAVTKNARVYAFEPESQNYALLNKNIKLNNMHDRITAYCMAVSNERKFDVLNLNEFIIGGSCHSFKDEMNFKLEHVEPVFKQGCFAMSLDQLVQKKVVVDPHHIKIDVDGIEHHVIAGMAKTLKRKTVKSVNIELNTNLAEHRECIDIICGNGFTLHEAMTAKAVHDTGEFAGVGNHFFYREGTMEL